MIKWQVGVLVHRLHMSTHQANATAAAAYHTPVLAVPVHTCMGSLLLNLHAPRGPYPAVQFEHLHHILAQFAVMLLEVCINLAAPAAAAALSLGLSHLTL